MKKIFIITVFLFIGITKNYGQGWQWKDSTLDSRILKDANDDLYVFSNNSPNFTIKKLNKNGTTLWTKTANGNASITAYKIDNDNNLVLLGNITSSITIDTFTLIPKGLQSFFILKLSPGSTVLTSNVYGSSNKTFANDLFINANGDYLIGGGFIGTFDMNGSSIIGDTLQNLFIIKTDNNQNVLWSAKSTMFTFSGYAFINEVVETTSGKIYATITFEDGLLEYNGFQFTSDGQFLIQLDTSRNIAWAYYLCYPGESYNYPSDIQTIGDTVYMKEYFSYYNSSGKICMWTNNGIMASKDISTYYFGYEVTSDKIYYATISQCGNPNNGTTYNYRKIGSLKHGLSEINQITDSIVTLYGSYSEVRYINDTSLYIGGFGEGMNTSFAGKFNMSYSVVANFNTTTTLCQKNDVIFENTSMRDTAAYWEFNGGIPATSNKFLDTVRFNTPGFHSVKLTSSNGISSDTIVKNIFINPQPAMPAITQVSNTLNSNYNSGNLWYYENDSIRLARDSSYQITLEGNYQVKYTDTNRCYNMSDPFNAIFNGISETIPPITTAWVKTISSSQADRGVNIIQTLDHGLLILAEINYNAVLIKYDFSGNKEWSKIIHPGQYVRAVQIKQASDSGYVLLVNASSSLAIIKLSKSGDAIFSRTYKYLEWSVDAHSFSFTNDGGYIISGFYHAYNGPMGFFNAYLLKIGSTGAIQWSKIFSTNAFADGGSVFQTSDGGYILNGFGSFPCCTSQNFICKLDQSGSIQWIKEYQNLGSMDELPSMIIANDNGYIMAGPTNVGTSGGNDAYVMKVSLTGAVEWCKIYGTVYEDKALDIKSTGDGYIVLGRTQGFKTGTDLYLFKIDNYGNQLWSRAYGTDSYDEGASITETTDHGFAITGTYGTTSSNQGDIYFIKTDPLGNTGCKSIIVWTQVKDIVPVVQNSSPQIYSGAFPDTLSFFSETQNISDSLICYSEDIPLAVNEHTENLSGISIFPNPTPGSFTIDSKIAIGEIKIYNMLGEQVYNKNCKNSNGPFKENIDLSKQAKEIYLIEILSDGKKEMRKVVLN